MNGQSLTVRPLGLQDYEGVWHDMQAFTLARDEHTQDELWLLHHPPVFTQGLNGKAAHIIDPGSIPVIQIDRGGQITYHGPGQLVAYTLFDLPRLGIGVRDLVSAIEQSVIDYLGEFEIAAQARKDAPGVYVDGAKIASLGLRVKRGRSYHGLSLNIDMDLAPFKRIHPCGLRDIDVTQLRDLGVETNLATAGSGIVKHLTRHLPYDKIDETHTWNTSEKQVALL